MKKNLSLILALIMVISLFTGCGAKEEPTTETAPVAESVPAEEAVPAEETVTTATVTFTINNTVATAGCLQDLAIDEFIEKLAERSDGRIQGTKVPGGTMGGEREVTEAIQLGTLEVALISDMGIDSAIGGLGWAWLPYMITTYEEADEYYINGWIGEELTNQMAAKGIVRIAATENDFRLVGNTVHPITSMADFQGLKIRTPEIEEVLRFYELCGALPVSMATTEVLTALEQKTIDGIDNTVYNHESLGVLSSLNYVTKLNYMYNAGSIVCNPDFWDSLSAEDQALFTEVATEVGANFRQSWRDLSAELLDKYVTEGTMEVADVNDEMYTELKKIAVQIWDEYGTEYDSELMARIKADFGNAE